MRNRAEQKDSDVVQAECKGGSQESVNSSILSQSKFIHVYEKAATRGLF